jgi:hypothetical protein
MHLHALESWRCIFIRWKAGDASGFEFWGGYIFILLSFEKLEASL